MPHRNGPVLLGEQKENVSTSTENLKGEQIGMGEEGFKNSSQGLKNGHSNNKGPEIENHYKNGISEEESGCLKEHNNGNLTNWDKTSSSFPCDDPAIIAKLSDFALYTNGLTDNNFDESEVSRPKKIYRVVLTGGKRYICTYKVFLSFNAASSSISKKIGFDIFSHSPSIHQNFYISDYMCIFRRLHKFDWSIISVNYQIYDILKISMAVLKRKLH